MVSILPYCVSLRRGFRRDSGVHLLARIYSVQYQDIPVHEALVNLVRGSAKNVLWNMRCAGHSIHRRPWYERRLYWGGDTR